MAKQWPPKDPEEVLDYRIEWEDRLTSEAIVTSVWTITGADSALVEDYSVIEDTETVIWLSGGTLGLTYELLNHIVTDAGREMEQTVKLRLKSK